MSDELDKGEKQKDFTVLERVQNIEQYLSNVELRLRSLEKFVVVHKHDIGGRAYTLPGE